jgi:hypothetical protein
MKLAGGALTALVILVGCGSDSASPTDGGVTIGPDGAPIPPAPPESPVVGGKAPDGIFVSSSKGIDGADGASTRPVKLIAAGLELAKKRGLPLNVCAETYTEAVKLIEGVSMLGYYDCSTPEWRRVANHAIILSPTSPTVLAENLTAPTKFEGFDVVGPDIGGTPAPNAVAASSYGVLIKASKQLTLADVTIRGGKGQDGADGVNPTANNADTQGKQGGHHAEKQQLCDVNATPFLCQSAQSIPGSAGGVSSCAVGLSGGAGGQGGDGVVVSGGNYRALIEADADGRPAGETLTTAPGVWRFGTPNNTKGTNGKPGAAGSLGQHGAWTFSVEGFVPGNGTPGTVGLPGQGGGGGAGSDKWWNADSMPSPGPPATGIHLGLTGGGGGAGGCGGLPGTGGSGGGASIGVLAIASEVTITKSRIEGKQGGRAGKGSTGLPGVAGGSAGFGKRGDGHIYGTGGGTGGPGGPAGLSGHGAPGPSIALAFTGTRPSTALVDLVPGTPGEGYGAIPQGTQVLPAIAGTATAEHAF